jgi:hypothetical protein
MSLFQRYDVIHEDNNTLSFDDGEVDTISYRDPVTRRVERRPAAITPQEARQVEVHGWVRALESVEHRIALHDANPREHFGWEQPPTADQIERKRAGLEAERQHVLDKLAALEAPAAEPSKLRR